MGSNCLKENCTLRNLHFLYFLSKLWICKSTVVIQSSPLSFMVMSFEKAVIEDDADDAEVRVPSSISRRTVNLSVTNMLPFNKSACSVIAKIIATSSSALLGSAFSCLSFLLCFQHSKNEEVSELQHFASVSQNKILTSKNS